MNKSTEGWLCVRVNKGACGRSHSAATDSRLHGTYWTRGCHGSDSEDCHLLGYMNPVRTSQETRYVCVTEPIQLVLCKV
jgi:hypothetical protein